MLKKSLILITMFLIIVSLSFHVSASSAKLEKSNKKAIVIASFGTSYPESLKAITHMGDSIKTAFPDYEVRYAFTSNIIRKKWQKRQHDKAFLSENKDIADDFIYVKTPLATIADLQNEGYRTIYVQPFHVFAGESYYDLASYVGGLNSIKTLKEKWMPFDKLVLGRPALGKPGLEYDYNHDIELCAAALAQDVKMAASKGAALVYMGHGNEHFSTGVYVELRDKMRQMYPDTPIYFGNVEGYPSVDHVSGELKKDGIKKLVIKPFMIVAGDHAQNDMAGDEDDSWKVIFTKMGIDVETVLQGLGEKDEFADIYVNHLKDLMK